MPAIGAAIVGFATSSVLGGIVTNLAIGVGASLLSSVLSPHSSSAAASVATGVDLQQQIGANTPIQFPMGWSATAGLLSYPGTWGNDGDTPNAYAVLETTLSWLPVSGHPVPWIGTQKCTVDWSATPTAQGYPITDFRDSSGKDYAWLQYDDGTQTTASSYMVAQFGSHPTRPYTMAMVGHGLAKVRLTLLLNQNLWSSVPDVLFETTGISLYNPAKDSSVGGSGSHRWGVYSTYEPSNNPAVQAYNVRRGIFYYPDPSSATGAQWVYGGDNKRAVSAYRLPVASWIAAINACDTTVTNADSSTEPQFRAGLVVTGDMQPIDLINALMGACNGRLAEVGGIYEVLAGAPGAAVYAFTDADIVISDGQSFAPFPGLEDTYNAIEATYPEPGERWVSKDAPGRYNDGTNGTPDWEDEDGGRQLPASASFTAVPYANQVQRLMQTIANDNRQFRTHTFTLPPDAYGVVKPNRIVSWTSARNDYTDKLFIVTSVSGKQGWNQAVVIKELDPSDYDYDPSTQQLPASVGSLVFETAPPQPMSGWEAFASTVQDNTATDRRPAITVGCTGLMQDMQSVRVQVRLATTKQVVFDGNSPYDPTVVSPAWQLSGAWCLPGTAFEVRGKLVPYSGRVTYWSNETESGGVVTEGAWLGVTTENVLLGAADISVAFAALSSEMQSIQTFVVAAANDLRTDVENLSSTQQDQDLANYSDKQELRTELTSATNAVVADYTSKIDVATSATAALAEEVTALTTTVGDNTSAIESEATTRSDADGALSTRIDAVVSTSGDNTAAIEAEATTRADADTAQSTRTDTVMASLGGDSAAINVVWDVEAGPTGFDLRYVLQLVGIGGLRTATLFGDVPADPAQPTRWGVQGGQFAYFASDGTPIVAINESGELISGTGKVYINLLTDVVRFTT